MNEHSYLASLKNKEFLILRKLCDNSISQSEKKNLEKELTSVRSEIERLG
jgi:hypothetical protein